MFGFQEINNFGTLPFKLNIKIAGKIIPEQWRLKEMKEI